MMVYFLKKRNAGPDKEDKVKGTKLIPWKSTTLRDYDYNVPVAATVVSSVSIVVLIMTLLLGISNLDTIENWIIVMVTSTLFPSFTMPINLALTLRAAENVKKPQPRIPRGPLFYDDIGPDPNLLCGPQAYPSTIASSASTSIANPSQILKPVSVGDHPLIPWPENSDPNVRKSSQESTSTGPATQQQRSGGPREYPHDYPSEIKKINKESGVRVPKIKLVPQVSLPPRPLLDPRVLKKVANEEIHPDDTLELVEPIGGESNYQFEHLDKNIIEEAGKNNKDERAEMHSGVIIQVHSHNENYKNRKLSF